MSPILPPTKHNKRFALGLDPVTDCVLKTNLSQLLQSTARYFLAIKHMAERCAITNSMMVYLTTQGAEPNPSSPASSSAAALISRREAPNVMFLPNITGKPSPLHLYHITSTIVGRSPLAPNSCLQSHPHWNSETISQQYRRTTYAMWLRGQKQSF